MASSWRVPRPGNSPPAHRRRGVLAPRTRLAGAPRMRPTLSVLPGAVGALDGGGHEMAAGPSGSRPITAPDIVAAKGGEPLVMVTAYDAPSARVVDGAGVDMILVGDTLAMVVLGYDDTLKVTTEDMA